MLVMDRDALYNPPTSLSNASLFIDELERSAEVRSPSPISEEVISITSELNVV